MAIDLNITEYNLFNDSLQKEIIPLILLCKCDFDSRVSRNVFLTSNQRWSCKWTSKS